MHPRNTGPARLTIGLSIRLIERNVAAASIADPFGLGVYMSASVPLRTTEGAAPKTPYGVHQYVADA